MPDYNYAQLAGELGISGRKNGQQLIAQCPLHQDAQPSFSLNIMHGAWTCFAGCGAGSFPHLVRRVLGCSLTQAHDWMIKNSSTYPVVYNPEPERAQQSPELMAWVSYFASLGRQLLPQWWFDRGLTWDTANAWDIRYDQDEARILIPFYHDEVLVGTIARNLKHFPKYKNSPGLPRNKYLFGLPFSSGSMVYLCEGPLDCLSLWQDGLPAAATLGAGLKDGITQDHIKILRGYSEICLAMDNDEPGRQAASRIASRLFDAGWLTSQVTKLILPEDKKDVGECIGSLQEMAQHRVRAY